MIKRKHLIDVFGYQVFFFMLNCQVNVFLMLPFSDLTNRPNQGFRV